jgi:hypothetical protein
MEIAKSEEQLIATARKAMKLVRKYANLTVVMVGPYGLIGETDLQNTKALLNVAMIFPTAAVRGVVGPSGQPNMGMALQITAPLGAHSALINRIYVGEEHPRYSVTMLQPDDMLGLVDLYDQIRNASESHRLSDEAWNSVMHEAHGGD